MENVSDWLIEIAKTFSEEELEEKIAGIMGTLPISPVHLELSSVLASALPKRPSIVERQRYLSTFEN